jgi:hypothetical protein
VTSSTKTTLMSKPIHGEKVADWTLEFFRQRNRNHVHSLVIAAMKKFGITQAELSRRLGRRPDVVCRWIGAPGNWTLDTVSDLLFAINGLEVSYQTADPLNGSKRNYSSPDWLTIPSDKTKTEGNATILLMPTDTERMSQNAVANSQIVTTFSVQSRSRQLEAAL